MIKRLGKKKESKQGAILVIVVLILALAMIFIASAMMLTQATRGRMYENTMKSQARLTVTAASEVFLEALQTQEITDDQLDKMLGEPVDHDDSKKIKMLVDGVPGMTKDAKNCTLLDVYYPDESNKDIVWADFTTIIGEERENVRIILNVKDNESSPKDLFKNQIDIGGGSQHYNLRFVDGVGMWNQKEGVTPVNNNIVIRGATMENCSSSVFYSNLVLTDGAFTFWGGGNDMHGDMVFLDTSYMSVYSSSTKINGDLFFFGSSDTNAAFGWNRKAGWNDIASTATGTSNYKEGKSVVFKNRGVQKTIDSYTMQFDWGTQTYTAEEDQGYIYKEMLSGRTCYFVGKTGDVEVTYKTNKDSPATGTYTVTNAGNPSGDLLTRYNTYEKYTTGIASFPSGLDEIFKKYNPDGSGETAEKILKPGDIISRTEYECIEHKKADGTVEYYEYKVYKPGDEDKITKNISVYKNPLTPAFPTKDYFKKADGTLNETQYHKYYDDDDKLKDDVKITISNDLFKDNSTYYLKPGWYQFQASSSDVNPGDHADPFVIAIDGDHASEYRLFFAKGDYKLKGVVFAIYNADNTGAYNSSNVVFILEQGAHLQFSCTNNRDADALCAAGIISIDRGQSTASGIGKYIRDSHPITKSGQNKIDGYGTEGTDQFGDYYYQGTTNKIAYSSYYDSKNRPCAYVFGQGSGSTKTDTNRVEVRCASGATLEAYIGMYGNSVYGGIKDNLDAKYPIYIYGRIEAKFFDIGHSDEAVCMPYCPSPSGSTDKPAMRPAESKYKVGDIIYYYNSSATPTPT